MSSEATRQRWSDRLFKWIGRCAALAGPLGVLCYVLLLGIGVYGLIEAWPPSAVAWIILKACYGALTIGAPLFFFCEYLAGSETRENETPSDRASRLAELKAIQDQGRAVWLACATVVGLILFKGT